MSIFETVQELVYDKSPSDTICEFGWTGGSIYDLPKVPKGLPMQDSKSIQLGCDGKGECYLVIVTTSYPEGRRHMLRPFLRQMEQML